MTWNISDAELAAARERAMQLAATLRDHPVLADAQLAAQGLHPVTVVYGAVEDSEDAELVYRTLPLAADGTGALHSTHGTGDRSTYLFSGPDAAQAVVEFTAAARAVARPWWTVTETAHPPEGL